MVPLKEIQRYCDAIAAAFKPQRIILFGSHAYGSPPADSDVDLLVVMPKARRFWMQTTQKIHERISAGFPVWMCLCGIYPSSATGCVRGIASWRKSPPKDA
jgi:hypothetical protein